MAQGGYGSRFSVPVERVIDSSSNVTLRNPDSLSQREAKRQIRSDRRGQGAAGSVSRNALAIWFGELMGPVGINQQVYGLSRPEMAAFQEEGDTIDLVEFDGGFPHLRERFQLGAEDRRRLIQIRSYEICERKDPRLVSL